MKNKEQNKIPWKIIFTFLGLALCLAVIGYFTMLTVMVSPSEWTLNINITADDNLLNMTQTADRMQERQYENEKECICPPLWERYIEYHNNSVVESNL